MKVMVDRQYPIGVDRLYEILTSKAFYETRYEWGKVDNYRFGAFEDTPRGKLIQLIQPIEIRTDKLPSVARRFLPESADLLTEFLWTPTTQAGRYQAEYRFELGNVPMKISGVMILTGDDNEAVQHTEVEISSSVPLVGKKLVSLVAPKIDDALAGDYRHTLRYVENFA
ncbi:hypothetical protein A3754_01830 [Alcanivorax sp. HI0083]|nr:MULTISPECIES: DUF2505 domain-containing protein [unclassified Alcanivorax]KZY30093.1 hypothetical protein A3730_00825 [Alcanivorax sp. HI0044]KZZ26121.1 hypothetical protein A3754_01830 [Alcanivorax sp. HI0083]PHR64704.1 MAG: DUF2505 domain-containing protein [Alcanivorax sp.]